MLPRVASGLLLLSTCPLLISRPCCSNIAWAQELPRQAFSDANEPVLVAAPTLPPAEAAGSELGSVDAEALLLRELDRLIELQERKVQLLTDMTRSQQQRRALDAAAAPPLAGSSTLPASTSAAEAGLPASPRAVAAATPPPLSPWHSFSVSNFITRAAMFLVAIACTVLYQHYSRKTGGDRRKKALLVEQEDIAALERQWRQRRLQSRRVMRDGQLRPRVHRGAAEAGGSALSAVVYGDEDELREEEEQGGVRVLDEGQGDFWDAQAEEHEAYAGVLGTGEEAEEEAEGARDTQTASSAAAVVAADDEDDDEEEDEESWQQDEEEEQEEDEADGHG